MRPELDETDLHLLELLQSDDRLSNAELGERVGLSISGVSARVRRLQTSGVITSFTANLNPIAVGVDLCAFIQVVLDRPEHDAGFRAAIVEMPEVMECHHVTGDYSYLLKVRVQSTAALERLISHEIKQIPGVTRSHTAIALSSPKETNALCLRARGDA